MDKTKLPTLGEIIEEAKTMQATPSSTLQGQTGRLIEGLAADLQELRAALGAPGVQFPVETGA